VVPRLGGIGSNMWEPSTPRAGNSWFQDGEALVPTCGSHQFLELGGRGSKNGEHGFGSLNWEPAVLRLGNIGSSVGELAVPRMGNPRL
jgi:hypothetical protein